MQRNGRVYAAGNTENSLFLLAYLLLIVALWLRQVVDIHRQSKKESPLFLGITLANVDRF